MILRKFSTRAPSALRRRILEVIVSEQHVILLLTVAIGSSPVFTTQGTESEKTWFWSW